MSFIYIVGLAILVLITGLIGSGTNTNALIAAWVFFPAAICLYFAPALLALSRAHPKTSAISILNLLLGWTLLGWVGALVWAYTHKPEDSGGKFAQYLFGDEYGAAVPKPEFNKCQFCAEEVKYEAVKCKHCQSDLVAA